MKPINQLTDYIIATGKLLLLTIWLIPLIWYLFTNLLISLSELSADLFYQISVMLLALVLAILPAAASALSLSFSSSVVSVLLFLPWLFAMTIPENTLRPLIDDITAGGSIFWYAVLEQWLKLYPFALLFVLIAIRRIDPGLFDLAQLSTQRTPVLIYKYFLPLLSPMVLLALLLTLSPMFFYSTAQPNEAFAQLLFSVPLLLLAGRLLSTR